MVRQVKYTHQVAEWIDEDTYDKMVSIFIHLPSATDPNDIFVKIHSGGWVLSFLHKIPAIFRSVKFMMDRYKIDKDDERVVSMGHTLYEERKAIEEG